MPRQFDDEESLLPSDSDNVTLPTAWRKCGAKRVSFSGSRPSPVKQIIFEKRDGFRSRALCAQPM
jgi:hypothetical protein